MRTAALFFVFLAVSAGTTWAVAPHEAAWVWTRYVQDSPEAYSTYAEKYPKSRHREKALFRRATLTNRATDLQIYLKEYPRGRFIESVRVRLDTLERRDFDSLRRKPDATRILEFIRRYPNSSRLEAVQQVLDTSRTLPREQLREELKQWIEKRETILQPYEDERFLQLSGQNQSGKTNTYSLDTPDMVSGKPSGHKQRILFRPNLMVFVKGGTFSMGNVFDEYPGTEEGPVHRVTLSSFFIGQTEVTFDEYDAYCIATGVEKPYDAGWGRGRLPVIYVSWFDATEYCNWLSEQRGLEKVYSIDGLKVTANWTADGYRLPTEAEWEFAARERGRKVRFGNGKDIADPEEINFSTDLIKESYSQEGIDRERTVPVGSLNSPNSLGLHDMSGNVEEWCWDLAYYYQAGAQRDPRDIEHYSSTRVLRGGSWCVGPSSVRTPRRGYNDPVWSSSFIGFRIARTAKAGER
ncbi:MAG: SUMF1/EgtB/PvdO family nonheme iron enzyme [Saprospirales bacterium]|nr:SUMF1/EgtB/PvdO family nonheme iron enzyme [Saprospirales bacterium]